MAKFLRDYQQEMLERLLTTWERKRSVMVQMPTGTGKTHLMATVIRQAGEGGVLVVVHRIELIAQISQTLSAFGVEHGTIVRGTETDEGKAVQVASIQTLARRMDKTTLNPALVIIDEAHHALAKTYRMLWDRWPEAKFLGLTATPCRMGGQGFGDLFDGLLQSQSISTFIHQGRLSDFEYISARPDSMLMRQVRLLTKRGADGDYQTREMATVMDVPESIAQLYDTYDTYARGKKGIVYAIDKAHARHIADYYGQHGVRCRWIEDRTPDRERRLTVEEYRKGDVDVIVNVDIFSEGFDCPEVEFIQLARPTLSLSKYLQQVGRGMRVSEGKAHVIILDQVGLYQTFGLPTADRNWQAWFDGTEKNKASRAIERCVAVDAETDKQLAMLQMMRIKKAGQPGAGLEIFLQDGRYGVMRNGRVTCPAKFKRIERLQKECGFFALGTYIVQDEGRTGKLAEVTTVIDRKGQDLKVRLYGTVWWCNGYFYGEVAGSSFLKENSWDPVGNSYYDTDPCFRKVAGVEIGFSCEHESRAVPCMKLRLSTGRVSPRFNIWEMFYNRDIIIARNYLVVKKDKNHSYRISGYLTDSVLVESEERYGYQQIMLDGRKGDFYGRMPKESTRVFNAARLGLQRAKTQ